LRLDTTGRKEKRVLVTGRRLPIQEERGGGMAIVYFSGTSGGRKRKGGVRSGYLRVNENLFKGGRGEMPGKEKGGEIR